MRYTEVKVVAPAEQAISQQEGGTHAGASETSLVLYMAPSTVEMKKAVKDYHGNSTARLTRDPKGPGTYSPTGSWGDPTLATRAKGRKATEALVAAILKEIEELQRSPAPETVMERRWRAQPLFRQVYRAKPAPSLSRYLTAARFFLHTPVLLN